MLERNPCSVEATPARCSTRPGAFFGNGPPVLDGNTSDDPLESLAARLSTSSTIQAQPKSTRTDADAIFLSRAGVPTGLISIPNRYMHSPNELISLSDVGHAISLIGAFGRRLEADVDLTPR